MTEEQMTELKKMHETTSDHISKVHNHLFELIQKMQHKIDLTEDQVRLLGTRLEKDYPAA